jgi:hypothetical protein
VVIISLTRSLVFAPVQAVVKSHRTKQYLCIY